MKKIQAIVKQENKNENNLTKYPSSFRMGKTTTQLILVPVKKQGNVLLKSNVYLQLYNWEAKLITYLPSLKRDVKWV